MADPTQEPLADPFAPPQASLEPEILPHPMDPDDDQHRYLHLRHEGAVRGVGKLYRLYGILAAMMTALLGFQCIFMGVMFFSDAPSKTLITRYLFGWGMGFVAMGSATWLLLKTGRQLRQLDERVRRTATLLSVLWALVTFPLGVPLNVYVLYLLNCRKGRTILTEAYRQLVTKTPHMKSSTPVLLYMLTFFLFISPLLFLTIFQVINTSSAS